MPKKKAAPQQPARTVDLSHVKKPEIHAAKQGAAHDAITPFLRPGCNLYVLTYGQFSLIHALVAILDKTGPADVDVSTWTAAHAHLDQAVRLMRDDRIRRCRWLVDNSFVARQPAYCARMRELFGDDCIRTAKTHAKFLNIRADGWRVVVDTSQNLNENPRMENVRITDDAAYSDFLARVIDDVFNEHAAGDFGADLPGLASIENVEIPGRLNYPRPTAGELPRLNRPSVGKQ